jgi:hypothetical protein
MLFTPAVCLPLELYSVLLTKSAHSHAEPASATINDSAPKLYIHMLRQLVYKHCTVRATPQSSITIISSKLSQTKCAVSAADQVKVHCASSGTTVAERAPAL